MDLHVLVLPTTDSSLRSGDMKPLFEAIIEHSSCSINKSEHLQMLVTNLDHSDFLGPIAVGRIFGGILHVGQQVICCKKDKVSSPDAVTKLFKFIGLEKVDVEKVRVW